MAMSTWLQGEPETAASSSLPPCSVNAKAQKLGNIMSLDIELKPSLRQPRSKAQGHVFTVTRSQLCCLISTAGMLRKSMWEACASQWWS